MTSPLPVKVPTREQWAKAMFHIQSMKDWASLFLAEPQTIAWQHHAHDSLELVIAALGLRVVAADEPAAQPSREAALVKALEPFARLGAVLQVVNEMRVVRQEYWGELRADGEHGPNMGQLLEKTSQRVTTEDFIAAALALAAYTPATPDEGREEAK